MSLEIMDAHNRDRAEVAVPQQNTNHKALKVVKLAIAAVCIMCGMVQGTASLASTSPRRETRYGKLTLVNDTISPKLIYLIPPSGASRPRYAYLPGCTKRHLEKEYSTAWGITTDYTKTTQIREIGSGRLVGEASQTDTRGMGLRCMKREVIDKKIRAAGSEGSEVDNPQRIMQNIAASRVTPPPARNMEAWRDGIGWLRGNSERISEIPKMMRDHPQPYTSRAYTQLQSFINVHCPSGCGPLGYNQVVLEYTREARKVNLSNMLQWVQQIAGRERTNADWGEWNVELTNVITNAAMHPYTEPQVMDLLRVHLETRCKFEGEIAQVYVRELVKYWKVAKDINTQEAQATQYMVSTGSSVGYNQPLKADYGLWQINILKRGCAVANRKNGVYGHQLIEEGRTRLF